jgi:outer membrane protein assembly factor BamB
MDIGTTLRTIFIIGLLLITSGCGGKSPSVQTRLDPDKLALAWTYDTGGPINRTPVYADEVVIVVPSRGPMLALDVASGEPRWKFDPSEGLWARGFAAHNNIVFVGLKGGKLAALDVSDGDPQWQVDLGINVQMPPLIVGEVIYVPTTFVGPGFQNNSQGKAKIFALEASTGKEIWSFESDNYILQTPFLAGDVLYAGGSYIDPAQEIEEGGPLRLYALSAKGGKPFWSYESQDGFIKTVYATERVVSYIAYQDFISGIDAQGGSLLWRKDTGNWVPALSGTGNTIYFGSANTIIHAIKANNGETLWKFNIPGGTFNYVLAEPVLDEDIIYILTQRGDIMALNAQNGDLLWTFPTEITSRVGLTIADSWLFIGDETGRVYAYTQR